MMSQRTDDGAVVLKLVYNLYIDQVSSFKRTLHRPNDWTEKLLFGASQYQF